MKNIAAQFIKLFLVIFFVFPSQGCDVTRQAQQVSNLMTCDFRILSVENIILAGVNLQHVKSVNDLNLSEMARILAGFAAPVFPLSLQLNLEGRNPNTGQAGLNALDWMLYIDDIHMNSGTLSQPIVIPAHGTSMIPVQMGIDLKQVMSGQSAQAILNFCMNLAGGGNTPTRFKIKMKPTIFVGGSALRYPGYITINTTYSGI